VNKQVSSQRTPNQRTHNTGTLYKTVTVDGLSIFYREIGDPTNPKLVLLHGFPASSHQYRNLILALADHFHVVAPDYPGFGNSDLPSPD
jgi:pimeloyl-ACP methyl ester carboxylesterase